MSLKSLILLLFGTRVGDTMQWKNLNSGIGAGIDSFYEYLYKAYVMFGNAKYLFMFNQVTSQRRREN